MKDALTFSALEARIKQAMPSMPMVNRRKSARVALCLVLLGALAGWAMHNFAPSPWRFWGALSGLTVEIVGALYYFIVELRDELPTFRRSKEVFAKDLDADYLPYLGLLAWIRSYPMAELRSRQTYLIRRQTTMERRFSLVMGSFEKLGILPVALALYLQLKDFSTPAGIGLWQGIFGVALLGFYVLGHWLAGLKLRLDLYADLFTAAIDGQA